MFLFKNSQNFVNLKWINMEDSIFQRKYILAMLISVLLMFGLSYLWHGVFLTDFSRIQIPFNIFLSLMLAAYFGISLLLLIIIKSKILHISLESKGFLCGAALGLIIYLIALTLGFSFNNSVSRSQSLLDMAWQMLEQGIGGFVIGKICHIAKDIEEHKHEME